MSGRSGRRRVAASILVVAATLVALPVEAVQAAEAPAAIAGVIKDSVGQVLDGVEVLLVRRTDGVKPVATATSDFWGRFKIAEVPPGVYSIAALKDGYRAYVGNVDTRLDRVLELVLLPMPDGARLPPGTVPEDGSWLLRLPRRTVFRETGQGVEPEPEVLPDVPVMPSDFQMRVDQTFAVGAPFPGDDPDPVKLQGSETRLRFATPIGERGRLALDGRHERLGSSLETDDAVDARSQASGFDFDFAYDLGMRSRLAVRAFYNERHLEWDVAALPLGARRQSWGYGTEWQQQLDDLSSLRLEVDYRDEALRLPGSTEASGSDGTYFARRNLTTGGEWESLAVARHRVRIGFSASAFDTPDSGLLSVAGWYAGRTAPADSGLSLELGAEDAWSMAGPFTLLYGLDYQQTLAERDAAVVVPSLGGAWANGAVAMRFKVSYHAVAQWDEQPADVKAPSPGGRLDPLRASRDALLPDRDLGYEAEVELPLVAGLRLRGASSFVPIRLAGLGVPSDAAEETARAYLADGTAAVGETTLALVHDLGDTRTWLEVSRSQSHGVLALGADRQSVMPALATGERTYDNGLWGFQLIPSGTDLRVEYSRVVESESRERGRRSLGEREMLELRLMQDLLRFHGLGNWRLLMAVRMAMQDDAEEEHWAEGTDPAVLRAFNEGVSAGLSVTF